MAKEQFFTDFDAVRKAYYEKHYCEDKKSWREIAKMLDTNSNRVRRDAAKLGIESRSRSDAQKLALSQGRQTHPTEGKKLSS